LCPTVGVTRKWAGVDAVWEREKLEAAKKAKKRPDSHLSGARIVRRTHRTPTDLPENEHQCHLDKILLTTKTLATTEKLQKIELCNFIQKMIGLQNIHKSYCNELE
jgi:hypothetical protein